MGAGIVTVRRAEFPPNCCVGRVIGYHGLLDGVAGVRLRTPAHDRAAGVRRRTPATHRAFAEGLKAVPGNITQEQPVVASQKFIDEIKIANNPCMLSVLAHRLKSLPTRFTPETVIDLLKRPHIVTEMRPHILNEANNYSENPQTILLEILERETGQEFDGRLWKAVEWADAQKDEQGKPRFDLRSPPRIETKR